MNKLPDRLRDLHALGYLVLHTATHKRGLASTIRPTARFVTMVREAGISFSDFTHLQPKEPIVLSRSERDYIADDRHRTYLEYDDTAETNRLHAEMNRINDALSSADLMFLADGGPPVDSGKRFLRRNFLVPSWLPITRRTFEFGGRLDGGWWQYLEKERRKFIRIEGEPIADLDFKSMFVRLAYICVGQNPPGGDLYAGILDIDCQTDKEREQRRDGIKAMLSTLLFATKPKRTIPRDIRRNLPEGLTAREVKAAILSRHPALEPALERGLGFSLFRTESDILVAALLRLIDERITALPMHDGIMVPTSKAERAGRVMADASEQITGYRLPIELKSKAKN